MSSQGHFTGSYHFVIYTYTVLKIGRLHFNKVEIRIKA